MATGQGWSETTAKSPTARTAARTASAGTAGSSFLKLCFNGDLWRRGFVLEVRKGWSIIASRRDVRRLLQGFDGLHLRIQPTTLNNPVSRLIFCVSSCPCGSHG